MDNSTLSGVDGASHRVYAFTSYPEIEARFSPGQADSAIDEIKRLMARWHAAIPDHRLGGHRPRRLDRTRARSPVGARLVHGCLPALTNELLGATPTAPGFSTWTVSPHPGSVLWARGVVPTPHGPLSVQWQARTKRGEPSFTLRVTAPAGTSGQIAVPTSAGHVVHDGIGPGTHTITIP